MKDYKAMFNKALDEGIINYDMYLNGYVYEYSADGWTDEIMLGSDLDSAFKEFCSIEC